MNKLLTALVVVVILFLFTFLLLVRVTHLDAHERGVKVGWSGIDKTPVEPGMCIYCPAITHLFVANIGQQRFVMNNVSSAEDKLAHGRERDEQVFRSTDNQDMHVSLSVQWHRDPAKIVQQQMTVGAIDDDDYFVETVLRQPIMAEAKNHLTVMKAIDAYSGAEHVKVQQAIYEALKNNWELQDKGCIIDTFVLEVRLDDDYTKPIKDRQTAIQQKLAYDEQAKAAEANALKAKAEAQADLNKQVVAAERDKQVAILKAEQEQQQIILAAEANKQQAVLAAQGEKEAAQNKADAILAVGRANAESEKLKYSAYSAPGADTFAKIQIAASMAQAYSGVRGWIPEKMTINTFTDSFQKGIGVVVNPGTPTNN